MKKLKYPISFYAVIGLYPVLLLILIQCAIPGIIQLDYGFIFKPAGIMILLLGTGLIITFSVSVAIQILTMGNWKNLVTSFLLLIPLVIISMFIPDPTNPIRLERARRISCENNLKQIYLALHFYAGDNNGNFPNKNGVNGLRMLRDLHYLRELNVYRCPSEKNMNVHSELTEDSCSYDYVGGLKVGDDPDTILLIDKAGNHGKRYRNAITVSGEVKRLNGKLKSE